MIYSKNFLLMMSFLPTVCLAELSPIADDRLSGFIGQSGITIDQDLKIDAQRVNMYLNGSEGVTVLSGDLLDSNPLNDHINLDLSYSGLDIDINHQGMIEIGLPEKIQINDLSASIYLSSTTDITPTTYTTNPQTYTVFINALENPADDDREPEDFNLQINLGGNITNFNNQNFIEGSQNTEGASYTFTVSSPTSINIDLDVIDDQGSDGCTPLFCIPFPSDGEDYGEILVIDENGDLVGRSGSLDQNDVSIDFTADGLQSIDQLGSNFFIRAEMSGNFDITGKIKVFH